MSRPPAFGVTITPQKRKAALSTGTGLVGLVLLSACAPATVSWEPRQDPTAVLYVLHGSGGSSGDALGGYAMGEMIQLLADAAFIEPVAIVAPPLDGWMDIPELDPEYDGLPRFVVGFSMGGYAALRWAAAEDFAGVGAISPAIYPEYPPLEPVSGRVFLGMGSEDHEVIIEETQAYAKRLGVPVTVVPGGHDLVVQRALIPLMLRELLRPS